MSKTRKFRRMEFTINFEENACIRAKIEASLLQFLSNLFASDVKKKTSLSLEAIESDDGGSNKALRGRRLLFSFTNPKPFAAHLQVLYQVHRMLLIGQKATKRDLFYECKDLYKVQSAFNRSLTATCKLLGTTRRNLRVMGSSRGFVIGDLQLFNGANDAPLDFRFTAVAIFEKLMDYKHVKSSASILLVVEKDAIFQKLIDEKFTTQFPNVILLTGRGYPDLCTREFLKWLSSRITVKFLALVDADPYGIEIFLTYKYGAKKVSPETGDIRIPEFSLIGLRSSEVSDLPITSSHYLPLLALDYKRIWSVLQRLKRMENQELDVINELNILQNVGYKLELEAVSSISPNFLCSIYLKKKFENILSLNV